MVYYYACGYRLALGSVVERGNWGRICQIEPIGGNNAPRLLREAIFENVRLAKFPDRPSRLDCNFLCPNIQSLRRFMREGGRPFDLPYEVELVNPNAKTLETDWSLVELYPTIAATEEAAEKYWAPRNVEQDVKEVLVESDIRIIKRITRSIDRTAIIRID